MQTSDLLMKAMGYSTEFPKSPITKSVRMLFKDRASIEPYRERKKYVPIKYRADKKDGLSEGQRVILKLVNKGKPVTGVSAAEATRWTRNHCSMILTSLFKKGLVKRRKESGKNVRWYVYIKKEGINDKS